jgi:hypothetical protein
MEIEINGEMERRKHPTYDREICRHVFMGILIMSAISLLALEVALGNWITWIGIIGFLGGVAVIVSKPINACACPTCRRRLTRDAYSIEFVCVSCHIAWTTRGFGQSVSDP